MNNSQTNVALNFNSRQNYGLSSQPQRKRQVVRQQQIQAPRKRNRGQTSDIHAKYIKDVYLLPDPTWETVPRRQKKAFLQTHNFVVDAFEIDKRWDLEELTIDAISSAVFSNYGRECFGPQSPHWVCGKNLFILIYN